jgi:hypothetical protein
MSIHVIEQKTDVNEALTETLNQVDGLDAVIILAIRKDGQQFMRTSTMSGYEKCFLKCFFDAWISKWFALEDA